MSIIFYETLKETEDFSNFFYDGYYPDFKTFITNTFGGCTSITFFDNDQKEEAFGYDTVHVEEYYSMIFLTFKLNNKKTVPYRCTGLITRTNRLLNLTFYERNNMVIDYKVDNKVPTPISLSLPSHYERITLRKGSTIYRQAKKIEDPQKESAFFSDDINYPFRTVATARLSNAGNNTAGIYKYKLKRDINLIYFNESWRCDVYVKTKDNVKASDNMLQSFFTRWGDEQVNFDGGGIDNCANNNKLEYDFLAACIKAGLDGFKAAVMRDQPANGGRRENNFKNAKNVHYEIMLSLPFEKLEKLVDDPIWVSEDGPMKKKQKTSLLLF